MEGLEAFDGLESSLEMGVEGFNDVIGSGAPRNGLVTKQLFSSVPDVQEDGLEQKIVFHVRIPDVLESLVPFLFVVGFLKDMLDQRVEEMPVSLLGSKLNRLSDVLEVMGMTQLDPSFRKVVK